MTATTFGRPFTSTGNLGRCSICGHDRLAGQELIKSGFQFVHAACSPEGVKERSDVSKVPLDFMGRVAAQLRNFDKMPLSEHKRMVMLAIFSEIVQTGQESVQLGSPAIEEAIGFRMNQTQIITEVNSLEATGILEVTRPPGRSPFIYRVTIDPEKLEEDK